MDLQTIYIRKQTKMNNFETDKAEGRKEEQRFAIYLQSKNFTDVQITPAGFNPDFDIIATSPAGKVLTFECKQDRSRSITGNWAIETHTILKDGSIRNSGITATKADFYIYSTVNDSRFYISKTSDLKAMWNDQSYDRTVRGGDGYRANLMLLNAQKFEGLCKIVTP